MRLGLPLKKPPGSLTIQAIPPADDWGPICAASRVTGRDLFARQCLPICSFDPGPHRRCRADINQFPPAELITRAPTREAFTGDGTETGASWPRPLLCPLGSVVQLRVRHGIDSVACQARSALHTVLHPDVVALRTARDFRWSTNAPFPFPPPRHRETET